MTLLFVTKTHSQKIIAEIIAVKKYFCIFKCYIFE